MVLVHSRILASANMMNFNRDSEDLQILRGPVFFMNLAGWVMKGFR